MRQCGRAPEQMRPVRLEAGVSRHAEGSCLVEIGSTRVLCTASIEKTVPRWMRSKGLGWVTGEYGMLPRSTSTRNLREARSGRQGGRTQEIQRLIGRALRICVNRAKLGERMIVVDCDVIEADGGTRCAAISGGYVALRMATRTLLDKGACLEDPICGQVSAISCGIINGEGRLDLDYAEDCAAETDANFVITRDGGLVELQATAESVPFTAEAFTRLLAFAQAGCATLHHLQDAALGDAA